MNNTSDAYINVLIKPSLHNAYNNSCNYYNYSTKQHVSALLGHHRAYKTVVWWCGWDLNISVILNDLFGAAVLVEENICITF